MSSPAIFLLQLGVRVNLGSTTDMTVANEDHLIETAGKTEPFKENHYYLLRGTVT